MSIAIRLLTVLALGMALGVGVLAYAATVGIGAGNVGAGTETVPPPNLEVLETIYFVDGEDLDKIQLKVDRVTGIGALPMELYLTVLDDLGNPLGDIKTDVVTVNGAAATADFSWFGDGIALADIDSIQLVACQDSGPADFVCSGP